MRNSPAGRLTTTVYSYSLKIVHGSGMGRILSNFRRLSAACRMKLSKILAVGLFGYILQECGAITIIQVS